MPNIYKYDYTYEEKVQEEDRECLNDFYRAQTSYYETLTSINKIILGIMTEMSDEELKNIINCNSIISPVIRLK